MVHIGCCGDPRRVSKILYHGDLKLNTSIFSGFAAGIYTTNSAEACFHCASNSRANIIVVQDSKQLQKILAIRSKLPHLKAIVQYEGTPEEDDVISVGFIALKSLIVENNSIIF